MDRSRQLQHLAEAEKHVLRGEQAISDQEQRIEELDHRGQDTTFARSLLETFLCTQIQFVAHRDQILRELDGA
ncbi:hypothetical protein [Bradyrhizobium sp. STM 3557]|uniref:hypothetical protein n=1 Tax=Bradyrhizobium sp. STM 3557 TaxID=578920 RepID=UPI0038907FB0